MKAVIYARYSSDNQREESIEGQLRECMEFANHTGVTVVSYSTKEGKQCLIDGFINAIYLYDDKITFTFNYKDGTQTISLAELEATCGSDIKSLGAPIRKSGYFEQKQLKIAAFLYFSLYSQWDTITSKRSILSTTIYRAVRRNKKISRIMGYF